MRLKDMRIMGRVNSKIRLIANKDLIIEDRSILLSESVFIKGSEKVEITNSRIESTILNTCYTGTPFQDNTFMCIKRSQIDNKINEQSFLQSFKVQYLMP